MRVAQAYGWTLEYIRSLATDDFERCDRAAQRAEARQQILACNAAAFPNAKTDWQKGYQKMLHRAIRPECDDDDALTTEALASLMSSGGLGG